MTSIKLIKKNFFLRIGLIVGKTLKITHEMLLKLFKKKKNYSPHKIRNTLSLLSHFFIFFFSQSRHTMKIPTRAHAHFFNVYRQEEVQNLWAAVLKVYHTHIHQKPQGEIVDLHKYTRGSLSLSLKYRLFPRRLPGG